MISNTQPKDKKNAKINQIQLFVYLFKYLLSFYDLTDIGIGNTSEKGRQSLHVKL